MVEINNIRLFAYSCAVEEKGLWNHGQREGTCHSKFKVSVPVYLQQSILGVRTEKCIQQASSVIKEG
jgi:hypothetical protein